MKTKLLIGLILVLLGTNLFTYATARYTTTEHVLKRARERVEAALKKEGLYEQVYLNDPRHGVSVNLAISGAGGMYYSWNRALSFWGVAVLLIVTGILLPLVRSRKKDDT